MMKQEQMKKTKPMIIQFRFNLYDFDPNREEILTTISNLMELLKHKEEIVRPIAERKYFQRGDGE